MGVECSKCKTENTSDSEFCKKCATPLPSSKEIPASPTKTLEAPTEELTTGSTFAGRYQIIEELGRGGMGKVYKAHDTEIKEKVALKLLKPEIAADEKTIERFRNEIRLARKIVHKNVGRMYDLSKADGTYFITMEYVEGQDLRGLIRQSRQLTVGTTINIAKQVSEGLAEAHKLGVVHRDLKPCNIMIDKEGNVRIMDFGIARSLTAKGITGAGVMIGTPEYMSPEQAEVKEVDQRSDIYSLGVILYEMVTGRMPFEGETPLGIAMKHKNEIPKDPRELNTQTPEDISRLILRCMEKDKEKRYQSADELRSELINIEKGIPTTEKVIPKRKPITSKEITVTFGLKKLFIPALVAIALAIIGVIIWQLIPQKRVVSVAPSKPSIAVLPFVDLSPQKDQEYLCDGLAEELINALSNIKDLRIVARTSAFSFKGKELDIRDIGEKLSAETVLEGSVRKSGNRLRITVQLINVEDGYQVWSERYEQTIEDVFTIQDEITMAIVEKLKVKLLGGEKAKLMKRHTENVEAYNLYLKGRFYWNKRVEEEVKKGISYFQQAIEKDPAYAAAYAGLADCYNVLGFYSALPSTEAFPRAKAAALKAMEIDDTLAEAHTSLAYARLYYDWDWSDAEKEFKRATELNPAYPTAHHWYAEYLAAMGRLNEAIAEKKKACQLDPLSMVINTTVGWMFYFARQYDQAIEQIKKALEINPNFVPAHFWLGQAFEQKGMFQEAIAEFQKAITLSKGSTYTVAALAHAYAVAGERVEAQKLLDQLKKLSRRRYVSSYDIAEVHIGLGNKNLAFEWFQKAFDERARALIFLKVEPRLDIVRADPRFIALLKKMNLE